MARDDWAENIFDESGSSGRNRWQHIKTTGHLRWNGDPVEMSKRLIDRSKVFLNNGFASLSVGFANCLLDRFDRLPSWKK